MGRSTIEDIRKVMAGQYMSKDLNNTFITLVPKIPNPISIMDFRPISLCSVLNKLITKVIANRIKCILRFVIRLNQTRFISGRRISNNIILPKRLFISRDQ